MTIYVALGSNLGNREEYLKQARTALAEHVGVRVVASSALYETTAVGGPGGQPDYLNAVLQLETALTARELLDACLQIEADAGRRRETRWAARTLDIDLLCSGARVIDEADLQLPHPRLSERRFVLEPLCDLAPDWRHPLRETTSAELLDRLPVDNGTRRIKEQW